MKLYSLAIIALASSISVAACATPVKKTENVAVGKKVVVNPSGTVTTITNGATQPAEPQYFEIPVLTKIELDVLKYAIAKVPMPLEQSASAYSKLQMARVVALPKNQTKKQLVLKH